MCIYMYECFAHMYACVPQISELELWIIMSHNVGAGNLNLGLLH